MPAALSLAGTLADEEAAAAATRRVEDDEARREWETEAVAASSRGLCDGHEVWVAWQRVKGQWPDGPVVDMGRCGEAVGGSRM